MNDLQKIGASITGLGCLILISPVLILLLAIAVGMIRAAVGL